jgi:hypothetical protein
MRRSETRTNFDSRGVSATDPATIARGRLLPARPWTGLRQEKSRRKLFARWSVSASGWTSCSSWRQSRRACAEKGNGTPRLVPFAQTFEAPHVRFQERHNYATGIARRKPIGACQTRELRGRACSFSERESEPLTRSTPAASDPAALPPPRAALRPRRKPSRSALANRDAGSKWRVRLPPSCRRPRGPAP